jgi:hypothetical protein
LTAKSRQAPRGELADELALQLLPRRLALLDVRLPGGPALRQLLVGDHDVGSALADIDPTLSPVCE